MTTYSKFYDLFSWIHINSFSGLKIVGFVLAAVFRILNPGRYSFWINELKEYINLAKINCNVTEIQYAFIACLLIYGTSVKEFFLYDFINLNDKGRREYITEINRYRLYSKFNGNKKRIELQSKFRAYKTYKEFYKRDAIFIDENTPLQDVEKFFSTRESAVLKPDMSACGRGVEIIHLSDFSSNNLAFKYILSKNNYIMEELVVQSGIMKELHPQSVNTVRIYAFRLKDRVEFFGSHLRAGMGESVVDNAAAGGVIISISNDGIAWRNGVDEFGNEFIRHPDTGFYIPGIQMPDWDQAIELVERAMLVQPDIRFVGWDIAYTDNGWIIIEGNDNGQFHGAQIPHKMGFLEKVIGLSKEL